MWLILIETLKGFFKLPRVKLQHQREVASVFCFRVTQLLLRGVGLVCTAKPVCVCANPPTILCALENGANWEKAEFIGILPHFCRAP